MVNWYKVFYLFSLADKISCTFLVLAWIGIVGWVITMILLSSSSNFDKEDWILWRKWIWRTSLFTMIAWGVWAFIPGKRDMLLIIGGGSVGTFLQSDSSVKKIPSDLTLYLHSAIQDEIKNLDVDETIKAQLGVQTEKEKYIQKLKGMTRDEIINYLESDTSHGK